MRRFFGTVGFGLAGVASVVIWASIDSRLCSVFSSFCAPRAGECGGGVDACAVTMHSTIKLFLYVFGPMILFAALGYYLFARCRTPSAIVGYLAFAFVAHWILAFVGVRILHI